MLFVVEVVGYECVDWCVCFVGVVCIVVDFECCCVGVVGEW